MKSLPHACNRELLRDSLADLLSEQQEEDLAQHLSECAECRVELERLAAADEEWCSVGTALRRSANDAHSSQVAAEGKPATRCGQLSPVNPDEADSFVDFAVDFLEASQKPGTIGRLGEIDIDEVIGRGGMGIVLKGFQSELNRPVAVKVLAPHLASSGAARKRFAREAQAAAAIVHPNVMPILTVNSSAKLPYLVMPYLACESLQQRLDREGLLPVVDLLRIGVQVSRGLAAAHAQGLIHRDVKPANILLEKGVDRVMLTDFGLARAVDDASLTRTGVIAGTPQYMSPEQARGDAVDARSDLFSLGSVLYAMCTGRVPFRAETSYGILRRVTDAEPRSIRELNSEVPDWLERVIGRLHSKQPGERFQTGEEVAELLEQCLAHVQQPAAVPLPESVRGWHRTGFRDGITAIAQRSWAWTSSLLPSREKVPEGRMRGRALPRLGLRMRLALMLGTLATAAVLFLVAVLSYWEGEGRPLGPAEPGTSATSNSGPASGAEQVLLPSDTGPSLRSDPATPASTERSQPSPVPANIRWDDSIADRLLDLTHQTDRLEEQARQDWDASPQPKPNSEPMP